MKLLPKKQDLDRAKAQERKQEIDSGLALAKSVDALREQLATEKRNLIDWRTNTMAQVQREVDQLIEKQETLRKEVKDAEQYRKALLAPLDKEWAEVNRVKAEVTKEKENLYLKGEQLKIEEATIEQERSKVSDIVSRVRKNEQDTEKAKQESISLRDLALHEYEIAREEHRTQTDQHEKRMLALSQTEREYEAAIATIQIREKEVKDKEKELISREQDLARQMRSFRIAQEVLKQDV